MRRYVALCALLAACLTKEEKLALFDDDRDGFHTQFGEDYGAVEPWDCNDEDAAVYPGAPEACNGVDDDCDGTVDDGVQLTIYGDADEDGYGVAAVSDLACEAPAGWSATAGDCDDDAPLVNPGADDVCNGVDDDCDGEADEGGTMMDVFPDADGDGFGADAAPTVDCDVRDGWSDNTLDCDDDNAAAYPGADDAWYDGVDSNCDGADDFDADADGHRSDDHGGDDCNDADATSFVGAPETWWDLTRDNDCDGVITDQAVLDLDDVTRIDGEGSKAFLGHQLLVLPPGWADDEEVLLVGSYGYDSYRGAVYGFAIDDLAVATSIDDATFAITGPDNAPTPFGAAFGYSLGWAGNDATPLVFVGVASRNFGSGQVVGWRGDAIAGGLTTSRFVIDADRPDIGLGGPSVSGSDLDGDGVADLVTSAIVDDRVVNDGGSVGVFYAPAGLSGNVSYADADVLLTHTANGFRLWPIGIGDLDSDGVDDLALTGGGLVAWIVKGLPVGTASVSTVADVTFVDAGGPLEARDTNGDGDLEVIAYNGSARRFDPPASGTVSWSSGQPGVFGFADPGAAPLAASSPIGWFSSPRTARSPAHGGGRGAIATATWYGSNDVVLDTGARLLAFGEQAGDGFGTSLVGVDYDDDNVTDLVVGAGGTDGAVSDGGSIYLIPGAR